MIIDSDEMTWSRSEFGRSALGNQFRTRRLVAMGARAAATPAGAVTSVFSVPAEREGAFRFLESKKICIAALKRAAHLACARRCFLSPFVYVPVDQTSLNLTDATGVKGFGAVGRGRDRALGLQVMSAIAVTPDGTPQGLTGQEYWPRKRSKKMKQPQERRKQLAKDKETGRWLEVMRATKSALAKAAPFTVAWFQLDRGGDAWPMLTEFDDDPRVKLTVRAAWDRRLVNPPGEGRRYLWSTVERQEPLGSFVLDVLPAPKRRARLAHIQVRSCPVTLDLRDNKTGRHFSKTLWAVLAREEGTTPAGEQRIEWMLLTTHSVDGLQAAYEVVFGYSQRWRIENFHQGWKSGACDVEATQLRSTPNVTRWAIILASVAMRIQRLIYLSRSQPELPATAEFTQAEIDAVIAARHPKNYAPGDVPPLVDVVRWIADEGGYTGKSSGGPPGAKVLARGMDRLQVIFRLFAERSATRGKT